MKKGLLVGLVLVAVLAVLVFARVRGRGNAAKSGPCQPLIAACEAAGFKRGNSTEERRTFSETCLKPLAENGIHGEIEVDPATASSCLRKLSNRRRPRHSGPEPEDS